MNRGSNSKVYLSSAVDKLKFPEYWSTLPRPVKNRKLYIFFTLKYPKNNFNSFENLDILGSDSRRSEYRVGDIGRAASMSTRGEEVPSRAEEGRGRSSIQGAEGRGRDSMQGLEGRGRDSIQGGEGRFRSPGRSSSSYKQTWDRKDHTQVCTKTHKITIILKGQFTYQTFGLNR